VVGPLEVGTTKTEEVGDDERSLKEKFVGGWVRVMVEDRIECRRRARCQTCRPVSVNKAAAPTHVSGDVNYI
jgi:hypothetical protein